MAATRTSARSCAAACRARKGGPPEIPSTATTWRFRPMVEDRRSRRVAGRRARSPRYRCCAAATLVEGSSGARRLLPCFWRIRVHFNTWCDRYSVSGKRRVFGSGSSISALRLSASDTQVRVLECTIGGKIIGCNRRSGRSEVSNMILVRNWLTRKSVTL